MDELAALKLIFRQHLIQTGDLITINNQTSIYSVSQSTMEIVNPTHKYIDVYDYILNDDGIRPSAGTKTAEIEATVCEVDKITEEQFYSWKDSQVSENGEDRLGPSGREIWLEKSSFERDE